MESPLAGVTRSQVETEPYPHVVVEQALPAAVCARLQAEVPPIEAITGTPDPPSNKGYAMGAHEAGRHPEVGPLWRELMMTCASQAFLDETMALFGSDLRERYPDLEERIGRDLGSLRAGLLRRDSFADHDVLLDAEILVTTPVVRHASSSRSPHVDDTSRLFNGQLYFRVDDDGVEGGDVELYRFADGPAGFVKRDIDPAVLEPVKRIPYERNLFLLMINALDAVHAVRERPPTPTPRYLLNIIAHVEQPLFDVGPYQR
jgi:hypothetical protein